MQAISFYLLLPILYFISYLPFKILYFISDYFVFPILFKVIKYRREVVRLNLKNAFPEKSESERADIEEKFYRHLSDLFLETIKGFTLSKNELQNRVFVPQNVRFDELYKENRNIILTVGHYGNYEWGCMGLPKIFKHSIQVPYHKLTNSYFDKLFKKSRSRFGVNLFYTSQTGRFLKNHPKEPFMLGLANDQSAPPTKAFWTRFLNQDTSYFKGTETIARDYDIPVFFGTMSKLKRGYYRIDFQLITEKPLEEKSGFIMNMHSQLLEKDIRENPEFWLWTHRRWKHEMPKDVDYGFVNI